MINQQLASEVIRRATEVQRLEGNLRRKAITQLIRLDKILVGMIATSSNTQLRSLLALAKEEIAKAISAAELAALEDAERLIRAEAATAVGQINAVIGSPLATAAVSAAAVESIKKKSIVLGAPAKEWWSRQNTMTVNRFSDIIRTGYALGQTTGEMTTNWTAASSQLKRYAEAQIRTGVQSMANAAKLEMYQRSGNVVKGLQASATLDLRTSALCRGRDGMTWDMEGNPIDANIPFPGHPPWHWNCRTTLIPILKSWEELGINDARKIPEGTRASMNGQVPESTTYDKWFKGLTEAQQKEVLGPRRWSLWRKNKLSMRDMIDNSGNPLTIEQLEERT